LPLKCFLVVPISWTFTTLLKNNKGVEEKYRITCHQLPIQASAVTGHSAQGKTLPKVLVNLHEGSFAAYVTVSHTQSHAGLCLSQPVKLLRENQHFAALEHNTYV
jgi:hypothetical protein